MNNSTHHFLIPQGRKRMSAVALFPPCVPRSGVLAPSHTRKDDRARVRMPILLLAECCTRAVAGGLNAADQHPAPERAGLACCRSPRASRHAGLSTRLLAQSISTSSQTWLAERRSAPGDHTKIKKLRIMIRHFAELHGCSGNLDIWEGLWNLGH